jgi:uncharacterized protein (DUF362 family)
MKRRKFIKISTAVVAANFLPLKIFSQDNEKSIVWEIEGDYPGQVNALFTALGGLEKLVANELSLATVIIKPNLCLPHHPDLGTTTSPGIIDALCGFLIENSIKKIIITDHTLKQSSDFQNTEINKITDKYPEVKLIFANEQRFYQPTEVDGKVLKSSEILKMLSRADLLINLATAKHHSATHVSLAIKNLMGLIWDRTAFHTQLDLSQAIADLALAIRPGLNIVDASQILLNGGPTGPGSVIKEKKLFASSDILALDAIVAGKYNFGNKNLSAKEVPHLWSAFQNGVGEIDPLKIHVEKISA